MTKIDFKKTQKALYLPSAKIIELIDAPPMQYAMIDGKGPPGNDICIAALGGYTPSAMGSNFVTSLNWNKTMLSPHWRGFGGRKIIPRIHQIGAMNGCGR
ncbi:hypothetical protein N9F04_02735 [Ascidiaceihabitans sp.]|nr:hypothetical protein [Ascidiaceihabitans sp.]